MSWPGLPCKIDFESQWEDKIKRIKYLHSDSVKFTQKVWALEDYYRFG